MGLILRGMDLVEKLGSLQYLRDHKCFLCMPGYLHLTPLKDNATTRDKNQT